MKPYRGTFGAPRPARLEHLPLPPDLMPSHHGARPLHAWRYVAAFADELMLCAASIRIGPLRQRFWAVWDREARRLTERTMLGGGELSFGPGIEVTLAETAGIETVCPTPGAYAWTRKQGAIPATIRHRGRTIHARAVIDDTAAYYPRHTEWYWAAGVGTTPDGTVVAWNLVDGVNDPPQDSERTIWIGGTPSEPPPQRFATDLSRVGGLSFTEETARARDENRLLVRSRYRQPFGTVTGRLPDGAELASGMGVMEYHDVWW